MKSVKSIMLNMRGQDDSTSKRNSPPQDPLSRLPQEIQSSIFSHLSLRERISCTAVSKYWRVSILNSQKTWHTLTDEPHGLYELYQVISKYQQYIQETDVREIVLTGRSNSLLIDRIPTINLNMIRLMHFLASLKCRSIEKGMLSHHDANTL
ncbi:hypothetical protein BJV82DRAFT_177093 [Fennellomyces sp. T-0311]|nr:hypothetical protein BJV82DRAFT_177093 [Fennellomyces sp. T-0311]